MKSFQFHTKLISLAFAAAISIVFIFSCASVDNPDLPSPPEQGGVGSSSSYSSGQDFVSSSSITMQGSSSSVEFSSSSAYLSSSVTSSSSAVYPRNCSGGWDESVEFCFETVVYRKCNNEEYNPATEGCCDNSKYTLATHGCENNAIYPKCGTDIYNPETHVCANDEILGIGQISGSGFFIDPRDGKSYKYETSQRTGKIWMTNNLNYSENNTLGWCYVAEGKSLGAAGADLPSCNNGYGRTYTYENVMDKNPPRRGLCPKGWHVPDRTEWISIESSGMSLEFYSTRAGNFNTNNTNSAWALGWSDRDRIGFYWTSEGLEYYFQISSTQTVTNYAELKSVDWPDNYFSVRCVMD